MPRIIINRPPAHTYNLTADKLFVLNFTGIGVNSTLLATARQQ